MSVETPAPTGLTDKLKIGRTTSMQESTDGKT